MTELLEILLRHAEKYSKMQPSDAIKLVYQNEFGSGHYIPNPEKAFQWLCKEYEICEKFPDAPAIESVGNGIQRVYISSVDISSYPLGQIFEDFLSCSREHKGTLESFLKKLEELKCLVAKGVFAFSEKEFLEYLEEYKKAGYPAVSHSEIYREAYKPAYRIIKRG
ncbi:MAG: hypothetical protein IKU89_04610 [Oscillospiraceae bacterium]|nr:hypothetical protein [Oscillospiraceae bacterium]